MLKYLQLYLNQCLVDTTASNWAFSNHAFHLLLNALCLCDVIFSLYQKSSSGQAAQCDIWGHVAEPSSPHRL